MEINGKPQVVYFLTLDLSDSELSVFPVLAKDRIFGFELLSEMDKRYEALASVNAGFNFSYGQPSGFLVSNGRILTGSLGYGRILLIKDKKAWFVDAPAEVWIECDGEDPRRLGKPVSCGTGNNHIYTRIWTDRQD